MSTTSQEQEIDLSQIGKSISKVFQNVINKCFDLLFFIQKKIIIVAALFILGVSLGIYLDKEPNYANNIVVIPNFGSNEYLYGKVNLIALKLKERDKAFFKAIGISNIKDFNSIDIQPINGIYNFINSESQKENFEFIKLMAEDGDIEKIIQDNMTSKNYYLHNINIKTTIAYQKKDLIEPILKYLQQTDYFAKLQKVYQSNLVEKVTANKLLISQIDQIVLNLTQNKTGAGFTISENSSLSELIQKKDQLTYENQKLAIHKLEYDKIIKDQNISLNLMNTKGLNNKMKLILPILFVSLFLLGYWFFQAYKQQKKRIQS
ncbi:hypothetical protein G6N05_10795 [Flavobacterium sp. F372]|uniref:Polysaccharide chain length determinant N-terminal domain-containing protein n=1 Tax=Flavobacterium bernardetii TaxID=2813823 RepID=A0ABR7IYK4_9FLAO|nr:hypothetical protein [Flavobacterium bernardetii]MBC5834850.1 hypothetical protein [Flavobacterium bernardetii]NHF70597.1 hypothetical protein [Flavobacterium bernardetii]